MSKDDLCFLSFVNLHLPKRDAYPLFLLLPPSPSLPSSHVYLRLFLVTARLFSVTCCQRDIWNFSPVLVRLSSSFSSSLPSPRILNLLQTVYKEEEEWGGKTYHVWVIYHREVSYLQTEKVRKRELSSAFVTSGFQISLANETESLGLKTWALTGRMFRPRDQNWWSSCPSLRMRGKYEETSVVSEFKNVLNGTKQINLIIIK